MHDVMKFHSQDDIDKSIEYLFPSGLDAEARPIMKPPEVNSVPNCSPFVLRSYCPDVLMRKSHTVLSINCFIVYFRKYFPSKRRPSLTRKVGPTRPFSTHLYRTSTGGCSTCGTTWRPSPYSGRGCAARASCPTHSRSERSQTTHKMFSVYRRL